MVLPRYLTARGKLSDEAQRWAKVGILDCLGCMVAGARDDAAAIIHALIREEQSAPTSAVIGTTLRCSAPSGAMANAVAAHVLDYDDIAYTMFAHPSSFLLSAALAVAEEVGATGTQLLEAYAFGFEVASHFGVAMNPEHYSRGWHSTGTIGALGAAAAAANLYGLSEDQLNACLGIAASSASGLRANFGSMTKSLHAGQAARNGVVAAKLAKRGFTANLDALSGPLGFFEVYGRQDAAAGRSEAEREVRYLARDGIAIKPYPCCGSGITLIDAALDLRRQYDVSPTAIQGVRCFVNPVTPKIMIFDDAENALQAKYCPRYCVAVALLDGKAGVDQFADTRVRAADVRSLLNRTQVIVDDNLPAEADRFGVRLEVVLNDGARYETEALVARGSASRPLTQTELETKFLDCTRASIPATQAAQALKMIDTIECLPRVDAITEVLAFRR